MVISKLILKVLEEKREVKLEELIREIKDHPGVIRIALEKLQMEGKIIIEKKKQPHKPKKYIKIVKLSI